MKGRSAGWWSWPGRTSCPAVVLASAATSRRCSSDPICSHRVPRDKEDFLHGAACHFCLFVSETSCERTNRFLDRRMILDLVEDAEASTPGLLSNLHEGATG